MQILSISLIKSEALPTQDLRSHRAPADWRGEAGSSLAGCYGMRAPAMLCASLTCRLWGFVYYFLNCFSPLLGLLDPVFILLCISWSKSLTSQWNYSQTFAIPNPSLFRLHLAFQFPVSKAKIQSFLLSRVQWHESHSLWSTLRRTLCKIAPSSGIHNILGTSQESYVGLTGTFPK